MTLFLVTLVALIGLSHEGQVYENGENVFQEYLRWNYTYMSPQCKSASGRNPCEDIRVCNFAAASIAIGGWPTLCGWVGKGVPKVCCGLPLVLGPALMKKVDTEISRKRECGRTTYATNLSKTQNKFFEVVDSLPKVNISDPNSFDPPLDLAIEPIMSSFSDSGSRQGEFPWMVSVRKDGVHACDGTLISRKHILTAAHCIADGDLELYTVHIGNLYVDDGYPMNVTNIRIHPGFDAEKRYNDVGLLTLDQEILTPRIAHICLPEHESRMVGRNSTLLQWGVAHENEDVKQKLCVTEPLKIVPTDNCLRNGEDVSEMVLKNYICTEGTVNNAECGKSTGGPLMYKNTLDNPNTNSYNVPWSVIGLNTFGSDYHGSANILHTRVASFLDWIEKTMEEDYPNNVTFD